MSRRQTFAPRFRDFAPTRVLVAGRAPLPTFAQGGFSTVWGGASLPADDCDIADWPVRRADLAPYYAQVLEDMPLTGGGGTLDRAFPPYTPCLGDLDPGAQGRSLLGDLDRVQAGALCLSAAPTWTGSLIHSPALPSSVGASINPQARPCARSVPRARKEAAMLWLMVMVAMWIAVGRMRRPA